MDYWIIPSPVGLDRAMPLLPLLSLSVINNVIATNASPSRTYAYVASLYYKLHGDHTVAADRCSAVVFYLVHSFME